MPRPNPAQISCTTDSQPPIADAPESGERTPSHYQALPPCLRLGPRPFPTKEMPLDRRRYRGWSPC